MNSEERSNEEKYPRGSIGHTFPEAAALMEGLLAERNSLESRLAAALARIAAVEALHSADTRVGREDTCAGCEMPGVAFVYLDRCRTRAALGAALPDAAGDGSPPVEIFGKPYHGWTCDCGDCLDHDARGVPRPGE